MGQNNRVESKNESLYFQLAFTKLPSKYTGEIIAFLTNGANTINYPPIKKKKKKKNRNIADLYFITYKRKKLQHFDLGKIFLDMTSETCSM